jgi:hypothetical protein
MIEILPFSSKCNNLFMFKKKIRPISCPPSLKHLRGNKRISNFKEKERET